ncbi:hypothetical protein [Chlamydiifrater volucris]|uniref:hypothetical protein n=1 Tax=Chlamydiifrater volucris TaxID=2681470 RepID=UPI0032B10C46
MSVSKYKSEDYGLTGKGNEKSFQDIAKELDHKAIVASRAQKVFFISIVICSLILLSSLVLLGLMNVVPLSAMGLPFLEMVPLLAVAGVSSIFLLAFALCSCCVSKRKMVQEFSEKYEVLSEISLQSSESEDEVDARVEVYQQDEDIENLAVEIQEEVVEPVVAFAELEVGEVVEPVVMEGAADTEEVEVLENASEDLEVGETFELPEVPEEVEELQEVDPVIEGVEEEEISVQVVMDILQEVVEAALEESEVLKTSLSSEEIKNQKGAAGTSLAGKQGEASDKESPEFLLQQQVLAKSVLEALLEAIDTVRERMSQIAGDSSRALGGLLLNEEVEDEQISEELKVFLKTLEETDEIEKKMDVMTSLKVELDNVRAALRVAMYTVGRRAARILVSRFAVRTIFLEDSKSEVSREEMTSVPAPKTVIEALKDAAKSVKGKFFRVLEENLSWGIPLSEELEIDEECVSISEDDQQVASESLVDTSTSESAMMEDEILQRSVVEALREAMGAVGHRVATILEARFSRRRAVVRALEAPRLSEGEREEWSVVSEIYEVYKTAQYKLVSLFEELDTACPASVARMASGNELLWSDFSWLSDVHLELEGKSKRSIFRIQLRCERELIRVLAGFLSIKELEEIAALHEEEKATSSSFGKIGFYNTLYAKCIKKNCKLVTAEAAYFSWIRCSFPYLAKDKDVMFRSRFYYRSVLFSKICFFVRQIKNNKEEAELLEKLSGWQIASMSKLDLHIRSLNLIAKYREQLSDWDFFCKKMSEYCAHTVFRKDAFGSLAGFLNYVQKGEDSDIFKEEEFEFSRDDVSESFFDAPEPLWDLSPLCEEDPELLGRIEEGLALLGNYGYLGEQTIEELQEFERIILGLKKSR